MNSDAPDALAVSVLIVTYKNVDVTRRCLESVVRAVAGKAYEVLALDNGSGDGTAEMIAREFPSVTLIPQRRQPRLRRRQ